ncbi:MAG: uracil-DNA glycosylase [Eubacteriales bacterium]|nr:uracil-DNA glycosylase [Eubacteriales bacterium]
MFPITKNWFELLKNELNSKEFKELQTFLNNEYATYKIYPEAKNVFNALNLVKYDDVKVVIIGQDPYHQPHQAHGLCFSVLEVTKLPPSLQNIFKEIEDETGKKPNTNGNLTSWAKQGVLLLNSVLTVRESCPNSHKNKGWELITSKIIKLLSERKDPVIFLLWGANAIQLGKDIDRSRHYVLTCAHPSPLSAYNGFFGCGHFNKTNEILRKLGKKEIEW